MIKKLCLLMFFLNLSAVAQQPSLEEVRSLYQKAESSEKAAKSLLELLDETAEDEPLLLAYKASGTMLMAKHAFSPFSKMSYFKKGKKMLQRAVDTAPDNVEIRFLRFAIQASTPSFLGYKDFMEEDKKFLLKELPKLEDRALKQLVLPFLLNSEYLTEAEKRLIG